MTYFSNMPTQVHDLDLLLYFKNVPPGHDYLWVNANVNFRNLEFLYDISFDQTYWVEDLPFDRVFAKQDGNHEPESLHVLRRWIDHNKMTVH